MSLIASPTLLSPRRWIGRLALAAALLVGAATHAQADVYVVNSTGVGNDGICDASCTLADAITAANTRPGMDRIEFNIQPAGAYVLTLPGALPTITDAVVIDATTQPGAVANTATFGGLNGTIGITLEGNGLFGGFQIHASDVTIRGFSLVSFDVGIAVNSNLSSVLIAGNYIGIRADGVTAFGNTYGIAAANPAGLTIGSAAPADRNLISGNLDSGIYVLRNDNSVPTDVTIRGNLIGTNAGATAARGNQIGILVRTTQDSAAMNANIRIGGTGGLMGIEEGNVLAGNQFYGIQLLRTTGSDLDSNTLDILNNAIGTNYEGANLGNGSAGVRIEGAIRGRLVNNGIANNGGDGVEVVGPLTLGGQGVTLRSNMIAGNAGLAIDLGGDGRTPNDADDSDTGANALLNFPVITKAEVDSISKIVAVEGTLKAAPDTNYAVDVYNSYHTTRLTGEDANGFLYTGTVRTDSNGNATFSFTRQNVVNVGHVLVATLTGLGALNYTSELSDGYVATLGPPAIAGKVTRDGSTPLKNVAVLLTGSETRTAVTDLNGNYAFLNMTPGGSYTVTVEAPGYTFPTPSHSFPNMTLGQQVNFSGTTVPAATFVVTATTDSGDGACTVAECTLREAINAANDHAGADQIHFNIAGAGPHYLVIDSAMPVLGSDLVIDGYTQPGARANTNATGALDGDLRIALQRGLLPGPHPSALVTGGANVVLRGLVISGFPFGITVAGTATNLRIEGNYFGTTPDGLDAAPNSANGISLMPGAKVTIGGLTPASRNLIAGHTAGAIGAGAGNAGVASHTTIQGNLIGTNRYGRDPLGTHDSVAYGEFGSSTAEADVLQIGGSTPAARNVIAGSDIGLYIARGNSSDRDDVVRVIEGNYIGVQADGETPLPGPGNALTICGQVKALVKGNVIANGMTYGVQLCTFPTAGGFGVELSENSIHGNGFMSIELGYDGRTSNDNGDLDSGANRLLNYPLFDYARDLLNSTMIYGRLTNEPNRTYRVEVFRVGDGPLHSGGPDLREFVASFPVTVNGSGYAEFSHEIPRRFTQGELFALTVTDVDWMLTSEASDPVPLTNGPWWLVQGTITLKGAPVDGVSLLLTGDRTETVTSQADGSWGMHLPRGGSYTITPVKAGYVFIPASVTLTALSDHRSGIDFTARPAILTRYLPEGAAGSFWQTSIALFNPTASPTVASLDFLKTDGTKASVDVPLTGPGHATVDPGTIPGLDGAVFSTIVRSGEPVVASRTMRWGDRRELGAHAEQALDEPRTSWYFAEGATGCFDLFYQLVNPGAAAAEVDVTFVRRAPLAPVVRHYTVGPFSRATVHANGEEGLDFAEVSAKIEVTNDQPIVAERAMYASCPSTSGQITTWQGGHDAVASPAPATDWFFAEGATGSFFDLYLLLANFEAQEAKVDIEYLLDDGSTLKKRYVVPASSRVTIDVSGESPLLANAAVSTIVRSKNGVPVVAERAQWWPRGNWYEGHVSGGVTQAGTEWHIAGAEAGGPRDAKAFLLIANTADDTARAQVTVVLEDGTTHTLAEPVTIAAHSRWTIPLGEAFPQALDHTFGVIVKSLPLDVSAGVNAAGVTAAGATTAPTVDPSVAAPIVVELSIYNDTVAPGAPAGSAPTRFWGAGTNLIGTRSIY